MTGGHEEALRVHVLSFGFKYGLPLDADHVVDVRFLANPYWISELRHLTGATSRSGDYVLGLPGARRVHRPLRRRTRAGPGRLRDEDKRYVTIAVGLHRRQAPLRRHAPRRRRAGCGRQGSRVVVTHRDLGRE